MFKRLNGVGGSAFAFAAFVCAIGYCVNSESVAAAPGWKVAITGPQPRNAPVVVTKITLGDVLVQKGRFAKARAEAEDPITRFQANDDWVERLSIYLLNRTDKSIVHGFVSFTFPDASGAGYQLELGNIPAGFAFSKAGKAVVRPVAAPFLLGPKQVTAIHLRDYIEKIRERVELQAPLSRVSEMHVLPGGFDFQDGMRWAGANYELMDPGTHTWRSLDRNYFPGNMDLYWPGQPGWIDER
jgi:hypothetical protein